MGAGIANRCGGPSSAGQGPEAFDIRDRSDKSSFANRDGRPFPELKPAYLRSHCFLQCRISLAQVPLSMCSVAIVFAQQRRWFVGVALTAGEGKENQAAYPSGVNVRCVIGEVSRVWNNSL